MPKAPIPSDYQGLPALTAGQMQRVDVLAAKHGLTTSDLMERAGRAVADETAAFLAADLGKKLAGANIVVCCGRGSNGGDGLVAARRLREAGAAVSAFIVPPKKEKDGPAPYPEPVRVNIDAARAAGVTVAAYDGANLDAALKAADAALDALLGTGSSGKPAGVVRDMIQALTRSKKPVIAVDIPSGLHPDTGHHSGVFVTAALTLTLGFPKRGLLAPHAAKYVGRLKVLDIGYPQGIAAAASMEA